MKTFVLEEREIKFSTQWEDLTLKQWIEFYKLNEKKDKEEMVQDFYLLSLMEILCSVNPGELDALTLTEYQRNLEDMKFMLEQPVLRKFDTIKIGDVIYGLPESMNDLTAGEYISIQQLQAKYKNSLDAIPMLLSVILRPVTEYVDTESGEKRWKQEKFTTNNLNYRSELFLENLKAVDIMETVGFFFSGKEG